MSDGRGSTTHLPSQVGRQAALRCGGAKVGRRALEPRNTTTAGTVTLNATATVAAAGAAASLRSTAAARAAAARAAAAAAAAARRRRRNKRRRQLAQLKSEPVEAAMEEWVLPHEQVGFLRGAPDARIVRVRSESGLARGIGPGQSCGAWSALGSGLGLRDRMPARGARRARGVRSGRA